MIVSPTYIINLQGYFYLPHLFHILDDHPKIRGPEIDRYYYQYTFETEAGLASILIIAGGLGNVGVDEATVDRNYTDYVQFEFAISWSSEFVDELINLFEVLKKEFTFVVKIINFSRDPTSGEGEVSDYSRLKRDYQQTHEDWKETRAIIEYLYRENDKHPDLVGSPLKRFSVLAAGRFLPKCVFICSKGTDIKVVSVDGHLQFELVRTSSDSFTSKQDLYQKIQAMQFETFQVLQLDEVNNLIVLGGEGFRIPLKLLSMGMEREQIFVFLTSLIEAKEIAEENVAKYYQDILAIIAGTQTDGKVRDVIKSLIELASKLDWCIVEGVKFKKMPPLLLAAELKQIEEVGFSKQHEWLFHVIKDSLK